MKKIPGFIALFGLLASASPASALSKVYPAAAQCQWSNTVFLMVTPEPAWEERLGFDPDNESSVGICSGAYVGENVIVTAGHCVSHMQTVSALFNHDNVDMVNLDDDPALELQPLTTPMPLTCTTHPGGEWVESNILMGDPWSYAGLDLAFCTFPDELGWPNLPWDPPSGDGWTRPLVPIMVPNGCEDAQITDEMYCGGRHMVDTTYVGQGMDEAGHRHFFDGGQLWGQQVLDVAGGPVLMAINPDPVALLGGDSGSPLIFGMHDGTSRVIGVLSKLGPWYYFDNDGDEQFVPSAARYTPVPPHIGWIESGSGRDLTPCHTRVAGAWVPSGVSGCADDFDTNPQTTMATLGDMCFDGVEGGLGDGCAGWDPEVDSCLGPDFMPTPPVDEDELFRRVLVNGEAPEGPFSLPNREELFGTQGSDVLQTTFVATHVYGGEGNDYLLGSYGNDRLEGGSGNDTLIGGNGKDILVGGRGRDYVDAGDGDDTVIVAGACELSAGESLVGGPGFDVLYTPLSVAQLQSMGVSVQGFEKIYLVHPTAQKSACLAQGAPPPPILEM